MAVHPAMQTHIEFLAARLAGSYGLPAAAARIIFEVWISTIIVAKPYRSCVNFFPTPVT